MPTEEFQQLLLQVSKLSQSERIQLQDAMRLTSVTKVESRQMSEAEFADYLANIGMITRRKRRGPIPDYEPIEIPGRPLSEDIIDGRGPR